MTHDEQMERDHKAMQKLRELAMTGVYCAMEWHEGVWSLRVTTEPTADKLLDIDNLDDPADILGDK